MVNSVLGLDPRSRRFESYHSDKLTGCNSVGFRELASDARGRWFESSHPDKIFGKGRSYLAQVRAFDLSSKGCYGPPFAWLAQLGFRADV